jgi:hypothetical protein
MFNLFKRKPTPVAEPPTLIQPKLPNFVSTYYDEINAERNKVDFAIDFDVAKTAGFVAFSVERIHIGTRDERTTIGFIEVHATPPVTHEWNLHCSREQHNKIVSQLSATTKEVKVPTKKNNK